MKKAVIVCFLLSFVLAGGCTAVRNGVVGVGATCLAVGQGLGDDVYAGYKAIEKADNWFSENYW